MKSIVGQLRFATLPAIQLITVATFFLGGWLWLGAALLLVVSWACDAVSTDYREPIEKPSRLFLNGTLYAAVPLMGAMMLGLVLLTASPGTLFAGVAAAIGIGGTGTSPLSVAAALVSVGLISGPVVGAFGHELFHRPTQGEWALGQVLLAHCLYTPLAIEHIHGHHVGVGTPSDFATVPRGQSYWRFLPIAVVGCYRGAARFEAARMRRRGRPWFAPANRFLQGVALEVLLTIAIFAGGGLGALAAFLASAVIGIFIMEGSNYVGHYGLVRMPGRPVQPRHSWNAPNFVATSLTINLTVHSHHHASASAPYWQLTVLDQAPLYPFGLAIMSAIALVPPIWVRVVQPLLDDWDRRLASPEELAMIRETAQSRLAKIDRSRVGPRLREDRDVRKRALRANEQ